jgi:L-ascorbate metabolism protein UlaG (beta-lactamase superfamily)
VCKLSVDIKWIAHSCFQIKAEEKIIYVDIGRYSKPSEKADLILITHSHTDHCDPDRVKRVLKGDTLIVAPKDCASILCASVKTLRPGEETSLENIRIKAVEAYNNKRFRSPGNPFHPKGFGVGYLVTVHGKTIYHAGDTDFVPEIRQLGQVDVALLPTGDTYTMDNAEAAEATVAINPNVAIPMHRWDTRPQDFKSAVEANSKVKILILNEGEEYRIT